MQRTPAESPALFCCLWLSNRDLHFYLSIVFCICLLSFPYHQPLFSTVLTDFCSNIQRGDGGRDNLATGQDEQSQAPSKMCPGGELMLDLNTLFILWWHLLFFVLVKNKTTGNSLVVQWLGIHTSTAGDTDLVPGQGTKRRRQWQPTPVLLPGKSHGRRSLVGCSPWDR